MSNTMRSRHSGFTLTEVLAIIVVIGILGSIVVVGYNGYQQRAHDAAVQSDLDSAAALLEAYRVRASNTSQTFPGSSNLSQVGLRATKTSYDQTVSSNLIYCVPSNYQAYSLVALSKSGKVFRMTQDGFRTTALTKSDFSNDAAICTSLSQAQEVVPGMLDPGVWATWISG